MIYRKLSPLLCLVIISQWKKNNCAAATHYEFHDGSRKYEFFLIVPVLVTWCWESTFYNWYNVMILSRHTHFLLVSSVEMTDRSTGGIDRFSAGRPWPVTGRIRFRYTNVPLRHTLFFFLQNFNDTMVRETFKRFWTSFFKQIFIIPPKKTTTDNCYSVWYPYLSTSVRQWGPHPKRVCVEGVI